MQALKKRVLLCLMCYSMAFAQEAPEYTWAKSPRANSFDIPTALELDDDENIYSSGLFTTRITFDQITLERPNVDGMSKFGSYICKHDKNGEVQWAVANKDSQFLKYQIWRCLKVIYCLPLGLLKIL